ncbi:MAG: nitrilase-related carbon-nitrogen hydrolase [Wenzhouxiangellaceae bacterium]|nr:nitrilase-related carbon-nitrogen hydrolase [Wenzhouxiangellaceae bacterium]
MYYAAACQTDFPAPRHRDEIAARVERMCEIAEQTIVGYEPFFDVRLLAFPEFAHSVPIHQSAEKLLADLAVEVPNEHVRVYERLAAKHGCFIQTGTFLERDDAWPGAVFNTTVLVGPDGVLAKYRKVNTWIPWEVHTSPHDLPDYGPDPFPVVDTEIGRIGVAICYDWLFPETIRELAFRGAEVLVRVSAYMDPWGTQQPMDWWTLVNRTRALENTAYVVAANQGARMENYPPFSWPGGSMVVDYDGRILAQADPGPGEKVVVAPIDIDRLRAERERRRGHDMRGHLRSGIHGYMDREYLPPGGEEPVTMESLEQRITAGRAAVKRGSGES